LVGRSLRSSAFHPEAVAADGAASAVRRAWSAPATSTSAQLVESPLIFQETEKALTKLRNCEFDGLRADSSELPDFPAAKGIGIFLTCAKRRGLFRSAVKLDLLPKEKLNPLAALCTYRVRSYFGIVRRTHT
jgi:hypothetical protein